MNFLIVQGIAQDDASQIGVGILDLTRRAFPDIKSNSEVRRIIQHNGLKINNTVVTDVFARVAVVFTKNITYLILTTK